jgi:hypothetical protein
MREPASTSDHRAQHGGSRQETRWQEWQGGATRAQQAMDGMEIFLDEATRTATR